MGVFGYYAATLVVYFLIYSVLTLGLNIQYGYAGILNFTYILFMALGAYIAGVTSLGHPTADSGQQYILGMTLPFPIPLLLGGLVSGAAGALIGLVVFRRLRSDYLAVVTFAIGFIAFDFVGNLTPLFGGFQGILGVPAPLADAFGLTVDDYTYFFAVVCLVVTAILWFVSTRVYKSPVGRTLRAIREDSDQAEALGKNAFKYKMFAMVLGCVYAGIGGALTIEFAGAMNPSGWTSFETFIIFAALIVGGRGRNLGAVLGTLLFPTILVEGTRLLPQLQENAQLVAALRNVAIGVGLLLALYLRPQGLLPERRHRVLRRLRGREVTPTLAAGGVADGA
jgi:ABC-type branched-subunit amino acid transport system permease subunit